MRWLVLSLALAGCSGSTPSSGDAGPRDAAGPDAPPPDDGAHSGARLKLSWYTFADGTRTWAGFYDAQRKEACLLYAWANGKQYCAPSDYTGDVVYGNAGCTSPFAEIYNDPSCAHPPPKYAIEYGNTGCDFRAAHLYARGAQVSLAQYWYRSYDGSCQGPFTTSTAYGYYALAAEVQVSELVEVTTSSPADTGRLGQRFYQSADGMRRPGPVHDAVLGVDCTPASYGFGTMTGTCVPSASYAFYLGDASCAQPKLDVPTTCSKPPITGYSSQDACPSDAPQFYSTGNTVAGAPIYFRSADTCVMTSPSTSTTYYSLGQSLAAATVAHAPESVEMRRMQLERFTTPEGLGARDYALYDTGKDTPCIPSALPDGSVRCVPTGGYVGTYYTNATCTQQADFALVQSGPASCGLPVPPKFASKYIQPAPGSCEYSREFHPIAGAYNGTVYLKGSTCTPYVPYHYKLYMLGPTTPLTDFAEAMVTTDP